jgi:hypothetical protein
MPNNELGCGMGEKTSSGAFLDVETPHALYTTSYPEIISRIIAASQADGPYYVTMQQAMDRDLLNIITPSIRAADSRGSLVPGTGQQTIHDESNRIQRGRSSRGVSGSPSQCVSDSDANVTVHTENARHRNPYGQAPTAATNPHNPSITTGQTLSSPLADSGSTRAVNCHLSSGLQMRYPYYTSIPSTSSNAPQRNSLQTGHPIGASTGVPSSPNIDPASARTSYRRPGEGVDYPRHQDYLSIGELTIQSQYPGSPISSYLRPRPSAPPHPHEALPPSIPTVQSQNRSLTVTSGPARTSDYASFFAAQFPGRPLPPPLPVRLSTRSYVSLSGRHTSANRDETPAPSGPSVHSIVDLVQSSQSIDVSSPPTATSQLQPRRSERIHKRRSTTTEILASGNDEGYAKKGDDEIHTARVSKKAKACDY